MKNEYDFSNAQKNPYANRILSMVLSIQRNRDLLEIFRLCQADPSKVEKCLSILKEDI